MAIFPSASLEEPVNKLNDYGTLEQWLVLGPFPNPPIDAPAGQPDRGGFACDYLDSLGGEAAAQLDVNTVVDYDGHVATTSASVVGLSGKLDFERLYGEADDSVAYAFCIIDHPRDETVVCDFGSDDGAKVWLNGELMHELWVLSRSCVLGSERFDLNLKAGRNRLLVKIENYRGNWEFAMSVYTLASRESVARNQALSTSMRGHPPIAMALKKPLIDEFGQYRHADWPGKTAGADDLRASRQRESAAITGDPGPRDWSVFGGWQDGPTLTATGYFRTQKHEGRWWLVDPLGKLFFSHGIDCVNFGEPTGLDDRRDWFASLPERDGEFAACYGTRPGLHGYYAGKSPATFDFARANLLRKYGKDWMGDYATRIHDRLRHWGLNTLGCWTDRSLFSVARTPYTDYLNTGGVKLAGSKGYWRGFTDVFDPSFRASLDKALTATPADDPWRIGYFVDNELNWDEDTSLAVATLRSPGEQAAKRHMVSRLREKYGEIEGLNHTWRTEHASWDALLESTLAPEHDGAHEDLGEFSTLFAETYFRTCRDAIKAHAPNALYLGCRFAHAHPNHAMPARAAAKFCDVLSYNLYKLSIEKVVLPDDADVPVVVGEFHFGALDRGMFHTGLREVASQDERAATYRRYVASVLANPRFVGCHWFQYRDSPTTGRVLDGENYQIGFIDICDQPYVETVAASREVGDTMYEMRARIG